MTDYNIGNLVAGFKFDTSGLSSGVANFKKGMNDMSGATNGVKGALSGLSASFTALLANPIGLIATAVAGLAAFGKAAFDASEEINSAYDVIRVGTGATEEALAGLQESFDNVYGNYAAETEDVATAIADLNTRLGLTGEPLEELSTQFLALNRMLEVDVSSAIESASKAFQSWGVESEDYAETLDLIFRASQATGAEITALADSLAQNGATFRTLGFSIEEAAAMLGTFEKEGINSASVLSSLQIALRTFASEGVTDASEALNQVIDSIKSASSAEEAMTLATDVFGRSATEMVDAIRSGRFEFDELTAAIQNTDETIMTADAATTGFAERFQTLGNKVTLALTPLGTNIEQTLDVVFKGLNWIAENILPGLAQAYSDFVNFTQGTVGKLVTPFLNFFGKVADTFKKFWKGNESETTSAVSVIMGRISELTDSIGKALDWILTTIWPVIELWIEQLVNLISLASSLIAGDWEGAWKAVLSIAETAGRALYSAMEYIWNGIAKGIENVLQGIVNGFFSAMNSAIDIVENAINGLARMWNNSWLAELTGWKAGTVSWHLETPDVPELLKFGDSALGKGWAEKLDSLIDTTEIEQTKTNSIIDTSTGKIDSTLQSGFAGLGGDLTSMQNSLQSGLAGMQNSLNSISANTATSAVQNLQQAVAGETSKYYDSSGNFVNRDDYYSGEYYFANATIEYLDDGRLVMTRENGDRLVMGVMKPGDREKYDIDSVFNVGGGVGGLMGNIAVDTRLKQEYEAYLAAKAAAEAGTNKTPNSSGGSSSGGSSSKKPTISGTQTEVIVGTPSTSLPTTPANKTYDSGGQTVNITVNGDVSTPSSFAQTVSNIANALSKPFIPWFT